MEAMLVRKHEWESTTKKTSNRCVVKQKPQSYIDSYIRNRISSQVLGQGLRGS